MTPSAWRGTSAHPYRFSDPEPRRLPIIGCAYQPPASTAPVLEVSRSPWPDRLVAIFRTVSLIGLGLFIAALVVIAGRVGH
jgi:hypothetical protein